MKNNNLETLVFWYLSGVNSNCHQGSRALRFHEVYELIRQIEILFIITGGIIRQSSIYFSILHNNFLTFLNR